MPTSAPTFDTIALIGRPHSPGVAQPLAQLAQFLHARGHHVILEQASAESTQLSQYPCAAASDLGKLVQLAIVIGGDGTLLSMARQLAPFGVPLIGINQGRLGFLTDVSLAEMEPTLEKMLGGHHVAEERTLLTASLIRAGSPIADALALNDVVINRGALGGMIDCSVKVDLRFVYAMRADGLIIATPTGSTAYALSAQGPIVDPKVPALLLVPVAPHALTNRPIAIGEDAIIEVELTRGKDASLHCDGQWHFPLQENDRVVVRRAEFRVRLLHPEGHDHFAMLRQKLHWSETPERLRSP